MTSWPAHEQHRCEGCKGKPARVYRDIRGQLRCDEHWLPITLVSKDEEFAAMSADWTTMRDKVLAKNVLIRGLISELEIAAGYLERAGWSDKAAAVRAAVEKVRRDEEGI